jgi:hypothetical protein
MIIAENINRIEKSLLVFMVQNFVSNYIQTGFYFLLIINLVSHGSRERMVSFNVVILPVNAFQIWDLPLPCKVILKDCGSSLSLKMKYRSASFRVRCKYFI